MNLKVSFSWVGLVIFILPAMFMLLDKVICKTTLGMTKIDTKSKNPVK